ncbi:MAG: hypothetical protein K0M40_01750 [Prolixibacteraceae bacterium]|nr:hypothetical protein [Prolixibacteraceae bacterium]
MNNSFKSYKKITVPAKHRFFGDDNDRGVEAFLSEFEPNTFISKGLTGCGATTILLENNQPLILSCPTNELCHGKSTADRHSGKVLWYKAETTDNEVREYTSTVAVPKFIAVYDQTEHLYNALNRVERVNAGTKYVLAVDEAHMLMTALSYREKAIKQLTALFDKFENTQFITATPLLPEFTPEAMLKYNYVEYEWESGVDVKVISSIQQSPLIAANKLINEFRIEGLMAVADGEGNQIEAKELIFFINSVTDIATLISNSNLQPNECKIIVSDQGSNKDILAKAFDIESDEVEITHASAPNKPITFVTSKAFEGVDFYSDSALSVVVSRVSSKNTLLDMNVSLPQIAGRIRTPGNKLKNTILFIYNTSSYGKSPEELENELQKEISEAKDCIEIYGRCETEAERITLIKRLSTDFEHGLLQHDETTGDLKVSLDLDAIKLKNYQNYITTTFNCRMKVINTIEQHAIVYEQDYFFREDNVALSYLSKKSLGEVAVRYAAVRTRIDNVVLTSEVDNDQIEKDKRTLAIIEQEYPTLKQAFEKLGAEKMITTSRRGEKKLKQELNYFSAKDDLRRGMKNQFTVGEFYSNSQIHNILHPLYTQKGLSKPQATDISFYFTVEKKREKNPQTGNMERGYVIGKAILSDSIVALLNIYQSRRPVNSTRMTVTEVYN